VTVDPAHQRVITATYSNTSKINTYDWQTGQLIEQIPMSSTLNSIQGGKFWKSHLYMTANDPAGGFAVFDMDLQTGLVQKIIHLNQDIVEIEGLTFLADANGSITDFYVLGVTGSGLGKRIVLYHWK
jgi:aconitase B